MNPTPSHPTNPTQNRWLVYLVLVVLLATGIRTISTAGIWGHLAAGREIASNGIPHTDTLSYTQSGEAWIDTTWLYDLVVYGLWGIGGASAVTLTHTILVLGAFLLLIPTARRWGGSVSVALALLLSTWILAPRFETRPMIVGLFFSALCMSVLERGGKRWVAWAVLLPAQWLWCNMHGSFWIGPMIGLAFTIEAIVDSRRGSAGPVRPSALSLGLLSVGLLAITLCNPYGIKLHTQVLSAWSDPAVVYAQEWISPFSNMFGLSHNRTFVMTGLALGAIGLVAQQKKLPLALTILAIVTAFIVILKPVALLVDIFALIAFPFFCLSLSAVGEFCATHIPRLVPIERNRLGGIMTIVVLALAIASLGMIVSNTYHTREGSCSAFGLGAEYDLFPEAALRVMEREDFPERVLNLVPDGGFLAWQLPERKVFVDQRAEVYGDTFYETLFNGLLRGEPQSFQALIEEWKPGAILINACVRNAPIAVRNLLMGGRWALTYFDGTSAIFVEASPDNDSLIADKESQAAGLQILEQEFRDYRAKLGSWIKPPVPPRLVGAGSIFLALNRYKESAAIYSALTRGAPAMNMAWLSLGMCQLEMDEPEKAVDSLKTAVRILPKQQRQQRARAWIEMSRAYVKMDATDEAQAAFEQGVQIDSALAQALGNPVTAEK